MPRLNGFEDFKQLLKEKLAVSKEIADISKEIPEILKREWFNWLSSQPYHSYITNEFHDKRDFLFCAAWNKVTKQFDIDLEETFYQYGLFKIPQIKETICPKLINFVNQYKICGNFFLTFSFNILGEFEIAINWKELLSVSNVEEAMNRRSKTISEVRLTRSKRENNDILWKYNRNFWHFNPLEEQKKKSNFWDELIKLINQFTSEITLNPLFSLLIIFLDINSTVFISNNGVSKNSKEYNNGLKKKLTSKKADLYWEIWNNRIQPHLNNTNNNTNTLCLKTNLERVKLFNEITQIHSSHQAYKDLKKWIEIPNLNRL